MNGKSKREANNNVAKKDKIIPAKIRCKTCKKIKSSSEFYDMQTNKTGKNTSCKKCVLAKAKKRVKEKAKERNIRTEYDYINLNKGWMYNKRTGESKPVPKIDPRAFRKGQQIIAP